MSTAVLLAAAITVAVFVGINIGGSSTGVAFGPATGSDAVSMHTAAVLMAVFAFLGGVTVGPNVAHTLGKGIVPPSSFTPVAAIIVLLFTGTGILLGNLVKVSSSTSEIAVGAVIGLGVGLGTVQWGTVGKILTWWAVSAVIAFWLTAVIGRYLYDNIESWLGFDTERRKPYAQALVVVVGCYMAFSAGASNAANAAAPLLGGGFLSMTPAVVLAGVAIAAGAFLLGKRTMETVGHELTDLSLTAAFIVELIAATVIAGLSWMGIPASLAVTATLCVIGLGWGRSTRHVSLAAEVGLPGAEKQGREPEPLHLYNKDATRRVITTWLATPTVAAVLTYLTVLAARLVGVL